MVCIELMTRVRNQTCFVYMVCDLPWATSGLNSSSRAHYSFIFKWEEHHIIQHLPNTASVRSLLTNLLSCDPRCLGLALMQPALIAFELARPNVTLQRATVPRCPLAFGWTAHVTDNHLMTLSSLPLPLFLLRDQPLGAARCQVLLCEQRKLLSLPAAVIMSLEQHSACVSRGQQRAFVYGALKNMLLFTNVCNSCCGWRKILTTWL